jgi:hypothetical protein
MTKKQNRPLLKGIFILMSILVCIFLTVLISDIITGDFVEPVKCVETIDVNSRDVTSDVVSYRTRTDCYKFHESKFWLTPFWGVTVKYSGWLMLFQKNNGIWMYKGSWVPI